MDLKDLNDPLPKPWLNPQCNSLTVNELFVNGRVKQTAAQHITPYGLWASTGDLNVNGTTLVMAMGSFIGPATIPSGDCYNGMTTRIVVSGLISTSGAETTTFSIQNQDGTYVHSSVNFVAGGAVTNIPIKIEFDIQIATVGGPGVGYQRSCGTTSYGTAGGGVVNTITDNSTFDSTSGVQYYLFVQHSVSGCTFARQLSSATVTF